MSRIEREQREMLQRMRDNWQLRTGAALMDDSWLEEGNLLKLWDMGNPLYRQHEDLAEWSVGWMQEAIRHLDNIQTPWQELEQIASHQQGLLIWNDRRCDHESGTTSNTLASMIMRGMIPERDWPRPWIFGPVLITGFIPMGAVRPLVPCPLSPNQIQVLFRAEAQAKALIGAMGRSR